MESAQSLSEQLQQTDRPIPLAREMLAASARAEKQRFQEGEAVAELIRHRSTTVDQVLLGLWKRYSLAQSDDIALIAVGGYGRGELHPYSDIDLLILSRAELSAEAKEDLSAFITLLWDLRLDIGHSVRTLDECLQAACEDLTILTNLLETRTIAGSDHLRQTLSDSVFSDEISTDSGFFIAKRDEQRRRHEKYADVEYNLEPNLKGAIGGLRDIQTIGWITKRHFGLDRLSDLQEEGILTRDELDTLINGEHFLWRLRYALQLVAARNENRLLFDHQKAMAELLGYRDTGERLAVEVMMQAYYRTVLSLGELIEVILQFYDEAILGREQKSLVHPLNRRFQIRDGYIEAVNTQVFAYAPYSMLEIFLLMAQHKEITGIRASTIRSIRAHRHLIDDAFRGNLAVVALFMEILRTPHPLDQTLNMMRRHGVLERYLPEFGAIIGQMQHDLFHVFTVDEHTIRIIRNMARLHSLEAREEFPLASRLVQRLPKREILYIAGLYHDIAKGRGGNHSLLGASDVEAFCQRHHLSERDTQLTAWLVEHHLLMSMTAQRRDTTDPEVIHAFAAQIPSQTHLDYLFALTVCDISATNPSMWNTWKASLLRQLFIETKRTMRRGVERPVIRSEWISATRSEARGILKAQLMSDEKIDAVWSTLDDDYFLQDSTVDIAWQTAAIIRHGDNPDPLVVIRDTRGGPSDGYSQVVIYMKDRVALFAATTAVLEQLNLNIVDAKICAGDSEFSISTYIVVDERGMSLGSDPDRKERIRQRLIEELDDPEDYPSIIDRRTPRALKHFAFPSEVNFYFDTASARTVMEVVTPDRPGLLARIGHVMLNHRIRLVAAKIATLGERVEDAFLITDEFGEPLDDPAVCEAIRRDMKNTLDDNQ